MSDNDFIILDEEEKKDQKPKSAFTQSKENFYEKLPFTLKQIDIIIAICIIAIVGVLVFGYLTR